MHEDVGNGTRRSFLKTAGVLAVAAACTPAADTSETSRIASAHREPSFSAPQHRAILMSVGNTVLPESLGDVGRAAAVAQFTEWCDGYDPVAEEMHGYGYADVRYLPPDPVPAWRAQLEGVTALAQHVHHQPFTVLSLEQRRAVIRMATRHVRGDRLPSPLSAEHVAVALLAHWASTPEAWNVALGVIVSPGTCRPLGDAIQKPTPVVRIGQRA